MSANHEKLKEKIAERQLFIFNTQNALDKAVREKNALQRELGLCDCSDTQLFFSQFDEKYKCVAKDADGTWWLYRDVPVRLDNTWLSSVYQIERLSKNTARLPKNVDWKDSLMTREA